MLFCTLILHFFIHFLYTVYLRDTATISVQAVQTPTESAGQPPSCEALPVLPEEICGYDIRRRRPPSRLLRVPARKLSTYLLLLLY
jgi:hypothetical protein